jgi:hypothetical protein
VLRAVSGKGERKKEQRRARKRNRGGVEGKERKKK